MEAVANATDPISEAFINLVEYLAPLPAPCAETSAAAAAILGIAEAKGPSTSAVEDNEPLETEKSSTAAPDAAAGATAVRVGDGNPIIAPILTHRMMLAQLFQQFVPAAATQALQIVNQSVTLVFVGHSLGAVQMAYYSLGVSIYNLCGYTFTMGLSSSLDTLCPQAFGRDPGSAEVGEHFLLGTHLCLLLTLPFIIFFLASEPVMTWLFGAAFGPGTAEFLRAAPFYLIIATISACLNKWTTAQRKTEIPMRGVVVSVILCPVFNYIFTPRGLWGVAASLTLTTAAQAGTMAFLALTDPTVVKPQWPPRPEVYSYERIMEFFRIGVPSIISTCSEWWVFEFLNVIAAGISAYAVDSLNIIFGVSLWVFAISYGWSAATGALVGNELGAGRGVVAHAYARIGLASTFITATLFAIVVIVFSPWILRLYTADEGLLAALRKMLFPLFIFCICDGGRYTLQSICRGAGRQIVAARVVLFSLWAIGLPGSYLLGRSFDGGAPGLFIGFTLGFAFEVPWLMREMDFWSWSSMAEAAAKPAPSALPEPPAVAEAPAVEVVAVPTTVTTKTVTIVRSPYENT